MRIKHKIKYKIKNKRNITQKIYFYLSKGESRVVNIKFNNIDLGTLILYFSVDVCQIKIENFRTHQHSLYNTFGRRLIIFSNISKGIYLVTLYKKSNKKNSKFNYITYKIRVPSCEYMEVYF